MPFEMLEGFIAGRTGTARPAANIEILISIGDEQYDEQRVPRCVIRKTYFRERTTYRPPLPEAPHPEQPRKGGF